LLIGESDMHADERAVAAAFLGAVRPFARERPLCIAVDDLQWLDAASVAALRYALARLEFSLGDKVAALEYLRRVRAAHGVVRGRGQAFASN